MRIRETIACMHHEPAKMDAATQGLRRAICLLDAYSGASVGPATARDAIESALDTVAALAPVMNDPDPEAEMHTVVALVSLASRLMTDLAAASGASLLAILLDIVEVDLVDLVDVRNR